MTSWEEPFLGTTRKIWRRSDQNWGRSRLFCDSTKIPPKRQKKLPKIQKLKYRQSPMSCFEGPPEADSVKVWWRSDQNWGRRYVFVIFLKIHQKFKNPKFTKRPCHVLRDHPRKILWKFEEDPIKTERGDAIWNCVYGALWRTTTNGARKLMPIVLMDIRPKD